MNKEDKYLPGSAADFDFSAFRTLSCCFNVSGVCQLGKNEGNVSQGRQVMQSDAKKKKKKVTPTPSSASFRGTPVRILTTKSNRDLNFQK